MKSLLKKIGYLLIFLTLLTSTVKGQDSDKELQEIQEFKDKLASKVAELQKKDEKATAGFILNIKEKSIKIITSFDEEYTVELDELLTKYYKVNQSNFSEITLDDFTVDNYVIITGPINGKIISANNIYLDEKYQSGSGIVSDTDDINFTLTMVTLENEEITLDVESTTDSKIFNIKTNELEDVGFSKIKPGDVVHFFYKMEDNKKSDRHSTTKILVIPQEFFSK